MADAVIVDAVRSPMGRGKADWRAGRGAPGRPARPGAHRRSSHRNAIDPGTVDDVLVGCVGQNGEQSATPGRQAWLAAGYPVHVPSTTIERKCGSGQQAVDFAAPGHRGRRLRPRDRRRHRVDEPGADGFGPAGRRPVRAGRPRPLPRSGPAGRQRRAGRRRSGSSSRDAARRVQRPLARAGRRRRARAGALRRRDRADRDAGRHARSTEDETIRAGTTAATLGELAPAFAHRRR